MAPGNPLALMWPALLSLVTWCCHVVVVVVLFMGRWKQVAAIDNGSNEMRVVVRVVVMDHGMVVVERNHFGLLMVPNLVLVFADA